MKYIVLAPGKIVTGGTELCHQLVHELSGLGYDIFIHYIDGTKSVPEKFKRYNVNTIEFEDSLECTFIIPEGNMHFYHKVRLGRKIIWWLSVDNYFYKNSNGRFKSFVKYQVAKLIRRRPFHLSLLKKDIHLTQSYYAESFLKKKNIDSCMLSDYISDQYFIATNKSRENHILYNPKKGSEVVKQFANKNSDLFFSALVNLSADEVIARMQSAKVYIDFGHHPGKDRIPREAAISGCVIITGLRGSAKNQYDISIPNVYKLDECSKNFHVILRNLIIDIFSDYEKHYHLQSSYRDSIRREKGLFLDQLNIFKQL